MTPSSLGRNHSLRSDGMHSTASLPSRIQPTLGDKRGETAILQDKLPKVLQMPAYAPNPVNMESDAWRDALWNRLQFKNLIIAAVAEFVGTFLFLFFALAINTRAVDAAADTTGVLTRTGTLEAQLFSSLGFGFSLCISAWVFFRISGGVQNVSVHTCRAGPSR
jgi:aquaporin related protein